MYMAVKLPKSLIEVSSEAGRKIGGIYTVLRSKSSYCTGSSATAYLLVGMLDDKCGEDVKFEEPKGKLKGIFDGLEKEGVRCRCGTWLYGDNAG